MQPVPRHCLKLLHGDSFATQAVNNLTAAALRELRNRSHRSNHHGFRRGPKHELGRHHLKE